MSNTEVFDYSHEALIKRGKYLTEVIDKIPDKANHNDIEELPTERGGRYVVKWSPSSGKTTAIRQFIVKHITDGLTGVVATKLVNDAQSLRYDIVAQAYYLESINSAQTDNLKYYLNTLKTLVVSFTNKDDITIQEIRLSSWVICTHERLFIEPSSILFTRDITKLAVLPPSTDVLLRKYLFVDEYPSTMYKLFNTEQVYMLGFLEERSGANKSTNNFTKSILVSQYIDKIYDEYNSTRRKTIDTALVNSLPTPTNQSMITDVNRGLMDPHSQFSRERVKFFSSVLVEKYKQLESTNDSNKEFITYSVADLPAISTYIFDGTGDLLFRNSKLYKIIDNDKFTRTLSLIDNKIYTVDNELSRKMEDSELLPNSIKIIDKVLSKLPNNEKLLVYYWKGSKGISDERNSVLLSELIDYYRGKVEFIYYQSGMERVTSKFSNINNVLILGQFFIPTYVISLLNELTQSEISTIDYTVSLIIQFIYRSSARHGNPIRLFIDNNYGDKFIRYLMSNFKLSDKYTIDRSITDSRFRLTTNKLSERNHLVNELTTKYEYTKDIDGYYHVTSIDLASILGVTKVENPRLMKKLDSLKVEYKYNIGDNNTPSEYVINPWL